METYPQIYRRRDAAAAARQTAVISELRSARPNLSRLARTLGCAVSTLFSHAQRCGWRHMYVSAEERRLLLAGRATLPPPAEPYVVDSRRAAAGECPEPVRAVFTAIAAAYGITLEALMSARHDRRLAEPRMVACQLAVRLGGVRPDHCAIWLGRHRHCGAYYLRAYQARHDTEPVFRRRMAAISAAIQASRDVITATAAA